LRNLVRKMAIVHRLFTQDITVWRKELQGLNWVWRSQDFAGILGSGAVSLARLEVLTKVLLNIQVFCHAALLTP